MKKIIILIFVISFSFVQTNAQTTTDKPKILYGACSKADLNAAPFDSWFSKNYEFYAPNKTVVDLIKKENLKDITVKIFFGTWCGDSKREVPHFLKTLDAVGFAENKISMIAVGASDSLYKQSPQHEESDLSIFKVPTFIFYKKGIEINRIVEFPVTSLERDILAIVQGKTYTPNYASFNTVRSWLSDGSLTDPNITTQSLSAQIRPIVHTEYELNSLGYVLLAQKKMKEAIAIFLVNYYLYPQSANVISSLGEGYYESGDMKNAVFYLETAIAKNTDAKALRGILDILYKAKGVK